MFIKNKLKNMNKLKNIIKKRNVTGYKLIISGRLKGIQRAKHKLVDNGLVKMNTLNHSFQIKNHYLQTKWGKWGIKLWVGNI